MLWSLKVASKLLLSRLPAKYSIWRGLGMFRHGQMDQAEYALDVYRMHMERTGGMHPKAGFSCLELGPGDSVASAVIARVMGARRCILIDTDAFARQDMRLYRELADFLARQGYLIPEDIRWTNLKTLLASCSADYLTNGLQSLKSVPDSSVDRIWSHAVLEHIPLEEFSETVRQMRRVLRHDGACSHRVDLRDHISGGLNNLRFDSRTWESEFMRKSGFYTNRIRFSEMIGIFREAGFSVEVIRVERWSKLPIARNRMAKQFHSLSDEDLLVKGFDVVLRPE